MISPRSVVFFSVVIKNGFSKFPLLSDKEKLTNEESCTSMTETVASDNGCFAVVSTNFPFTEPLIWAWAINAKERMERSRMNSFITVDESTNLDVMGGKNLLETLK